MSRNVGRSTGVVVTVLVTILVSVTILSTACGSEAASTKGPLQLGEADSGQTFTVKVGDTIEVTLPGNPTTGFEWTAALSDRDAALALFGFTRSSRPSTATRSTTKGSFTYRRCDHKRIPSTTTKTARPTQSTR